jgi:hypothetical protein
MYRRGLSGLIMRPILHDPGSCQNVEVSLVDPEKHGNGRDDRKEKLKPHLKNRPQAEVGRRRWGKRRPMPPDAMVSD